ncbi:hypothetical protein M426DRAFT_259822 [Hypoxylon sp. CI-4A]|nr:hypothetical protein M426DRAFT_259822 [Hypoxylon sp. CI-4A]
MAVIRQKTDRPMRNICGSTQPSRTHMTTAAYVSMAYRKKDAMTQYRRAGSDEALQWVMTLRRERRFCRVVHVGFCHRGQSLQSMNKTRRRFGSNLGGVSFDPYDPGRKHDFIPRIRSGYKADLCVCLPIYISGAVLGAERGRSTRPHEIISPREIISLVIIDREARFVIN